MMSTMRFHLGWCPWANCWIRFLRQQYSLELKTNKNRMNSRVINERLSTISIFLHSTLTSGTVIQAVTSEIAASRSLWPLLVTGRIEDDQCKNVDIPHAVDASEKSRGEFKMNGVIPTILSFDHLAHDEANDCQGRTDQCGQHQKFETINDSFVMHTPGNRHRRQWWSFYADITEYAPNHMTQKHKINARRNGSQHDECKLFEEKKKNSNYLFDWNV